jgi:hypothetical protein
MDWGIKKNSMERRYMRMMSKLAWSATNATEMAGAVV